jgi:hypothetical protein
MFILTLIVNSIYIYYFQFYENNKLYVAYLDSVLQSGDFNNFFLHTYVSNGLVISCVFNLLSRGYGDWVPPPPFPKVDIAYTSAFSGITLFPIQNFVF